MQNRRLLIFQVTSYLISYAWATCTQPGSTVSLISRFRLSTKNFQILTRSYHFRYTISLYQCDNYIVENNELSIYQTQNGIKLFIQEIFNRDCNSIQRFLRLDLYTDQNERNLFFLLLVKNHFTQLLHLATTNLVVICSHVGSPREISARVKAILLLLHFSRHGRTSCVAFSLSYLQHSKAKDSPHKSFLEFMQVDGRLFSFFGRHIYNCILFFTNRGCPFEIHF